MIHLGFVYEGGAHRYTIRDNKVFEGRDQEVGFVVGRNVHNLLGAFWFGLADIG